MQLQAESRALQSGHWLTLDEVASLAGKSQPDAKALVLSWVVDQRVFTIFHEGVEYLPRYALDSGAAYTPLPVVRLVLNAFGKQISGWRLVFWFSSPNSYLDGLPPLEMIATNPDDVILAAEREASGIQHG